MATRALIGCVRVSPACAWLATRPDIATRWVEMRPGDFLKAVSPWDDPGSPLDVNHEIRPGGVRLAREGRNASLGPSSIVVFVYTLIVIVGVLYYSDGLILTKLGAAVFE